MKVHFKSIPVLLYNILWTLLNVVIIVSKDILKALHKNKCKNSVLNRLWASGRRGLSLDHSPAYQFGLCQWQKGLRPSIAYVVYRWLLFISVVSIGVASFANQRLPKSYKGPEKLNYFKWFIYFTNWGYMLLAVQSGLALAVVMRYRSDRNINLANEEVENPVSRRTRSPLLCRLYWLSHTVATDLAFVITLVYWALVYDPRIHDLNVLNILVHGVNTVMVVVEICVTSHPVRVVHALYGAAVGLLYGVFSAIYWALGGTDRVGLPAIYPHLDWSKPDQALGFVGLCACVMISAHIMASLLAAVRVQLANYLRKNTALNDRMTLPSH